MSMAKTAEPSEGGGGLAELEAEKLRFQAEDLQRRYDSQGRDLQRKDENSRRLESRMRELHAELKELEERVGTFHREAVAGAEALAELEHALRVCDEARVKLRSALERDGVELERVKESALRAQTLARDHEERATRKESM